MKMFNFLYKSILKNYRNTRNELKRLCECGRYLQKGGGEVGKGGGRTALA